MLTTGGDQLPVPGIGKLSMQTSKSCFLNLSKHKFVPELSMNLRSMEELENNWLLIFSSVNCRILSLMMDRIMGKEVQLAVFHLNFDFFSPSGAKSIGYLAPTEA